MILLLGANGQLGRCLQDVLPKGSYIAADRKAIDFSNPSTVLQQLDKCQPWLKASLVTGKELKGGKVKCVINCIAYTDVAKAETEIEEAFNVNAHSVRELAKWCRDNFVSLLHVSTDYASEEPAPANIYGQSKLAGEKAIQGTRNLNYLIIRTSALFSEYAKTSFLTKVLAKAKKGETLFIRSMGCQPTCATDLALFIQKVAEPIFEPWEGFPNRVMNFCNEESISFEDFAWNIQRYSKIPFKIERDNSPDPIRPKSPRLKLDTNVPDYRTSLYYCIQRMRDLKLL